MKNNGIIESILSLSVLNGLNLLLPLVTLPYTIRVVGIANYGAYSIVYSLIQYVMLISSYGFAFSTTQQVAQNREDTNQLGRIFSSTIAARFILMIIPSVVFAAVCFFAYEEEYLLMYILGIGMVIGDNLNPVWLFQGMEKMRYMTIVNVLCKLIFTVLIFILIRNEDDYLYLTLLNSAGYILAGVFSLWIARKSFGLSLRMPKWKDVKYQLTEGWYIFLTTMWMNLYRNSNVFILSFFVPEARVGMYSGAEKIIKAVQSVASPVSNAFYPFFANKKEDDNPLSIRTGVIKLTKIMGALVLVLSAVVVFGADLINKLLLDSNSPETALLIRLMTPVIFFGCLNYVLGIVGLTNMGMKKDFFKYVMTAGIVSILFILATVRFWGNISASLAISLSEIVLFALCVYKMRAAK